MSLTRGREVYKQMGNAVIYVYKVVSPKNKVYIGVTRNFESRKYQHEYKALNSDSYTYKNKFADAIRKYKDSMRWQIIDCAEDYETAFELERRYILHFDSYYSGYNSTFGGDGCLKWTKEVIIEEAKKYKSKVEWSDNCKPSYEAAKVFSEDFFNECSEHMVNPLIRWSNEDIIREARKYKTQSEWKENNAYSYRLAIEKDDYNFRLECTKHMNNVRIKWTRDKILEQSKKFKYKSVWERECNGSFQAAKTLNKKEPGFYNMCTKHMKLKKREKNVTN